MLVYLVCAVLAFIAMAVAEAGGEIGVGKRHATDPAATRNFMRFLSMAITLLAAAVARNL